MDLQLTKMELIEMLLNTKKMTVLKQIKAILEAEQEGLSEADYEIINARRDRHLKGESKSFSWKEAKENIMKQ